MTTYRPAVYTASKMDKAGLWNTLRIDPDWAFCSWTARWVEMAGLEAQATEEDFRRFWKMDIDDIKGSDFLLLYAGGEEALKGALVEAGAAIAFGIRVVAVGLSPIHTWSYHPLVSRVPNLVQARLFLFKYTVMIPHISKRRKDSND